ncbi:MAG TPA: aldehyde dehydrogenase family protein, partial [Alphaproteobacteria bacterium]|nr:aldehyde dehydrogenase family protein [Alphaproteobacteria bacterium]
MDDIAKDRFGLGEVLESLGVESRALSGGDLTVTSPIDDRPIGHLHSHSERDVEAAINRAAEAFTTWRSVPAPRRGELIRLFGEELRAAKVELGRLVTIECGKILEEGLGEVQEMIDICDFAVGLSRQLYGLTIASERPGHRMMEQWHPLGPVGVITAFNFPVAVWSWNTAIALVCGDPVLWKPSEKTPITALACKALFDRALARFGDDAPEGLCQVLIGGRKTGETLVDSPKVALISATGSTRMGAEVGPRVLKRHGKVLLELGGNNAMIVTPSADLELAVRAIVFSAVGTAGQRCTTLRRLIVHEEIYDPLLKALKPAYDSVRIGDPLADGTLVGPLIDWPAADEMHRVLGIVEKEGGTLHGGGPVTESMPDGGAYMRPAIVEMPEQTGTVQTETFAPILYVLRYKDFDEAIELHNGVPQGLASCIFTNDMKEAERFLSATGSDCGIANVNIGPSGAEIGGAFGGEKATGGGRES